VLFLFGLVLLFFRLFLKQYPVRGGIIIFKLPAPDRPAKGRQENKSYGKTGSQQQYDNAHGYVIF